MASEGGVPVWGIEAGDRRIRAIRVAPRAEGGFAVLDYREEEAAGPGPEALIAFLKRRGLLRHAVCVAIQSSSAWFRSVRLSEDDLARPRDDMEACLSEYIHPEPESLDFKWTVAGDNLYYLAAEERARVESYMIALETAHAAAYSLVAGPHALHAGIRSSGLLPGDAVVIRVQEAWTDLLFLDGADVARQAVPLGRRDLDSDEARRLLVEDVGRLLEYHRTRVPREGPERYVLLGLDDAPTEALAALLPEKPVAFPDDATPVRGRGRVSLPRALTLCRAAPAALGAALGAVSIPRDEVLSLRPLPSAIPRPPAPALPWFVAAALLWVAFAVAFLGVSGERDRLRRAVLRESPAPPPLTVEQAKTLTRLSEMACWRVTFPEAAATALRSVPGAAAAPYATERFEVRAEPGGASEAALVLRLPGADADPDSARVRSASEAFRAVTGNLPERESRDGDLLLSGTIRVEAPE